MHATLYLISQPYLSATQRDRLRADLIARTPGLCDLVRLERDGASLWAVLDQMVAQGARGITLRPLGLPMGESLLRWLPGAVGDWCARQDPQGAPTLSITDDLSTVPSVLDAIAAAEIPRKPLARVPDGAKGKGWDSPPAHRHHLLVCTGPRCHLRDAPDLLGLLKAEIAQAGLSKSCLVASTGCLFPCNAGPVVIHYPQGHWYRLPDAAAIRAFVKTVLVAGQSLPQHQTFQRTELEYAP